MSLAAESNHTHPGWEEALRELVAADRSFLVCDTQNAEQIAALLSSIRISLYKLHQILGTVAHPLVVPEDIGGHIMSMTEGWENFWIDYDMLSAIHSPAPLTDSHKFLSFDVDNTFVVEDVTGPEIVDKTTSNLAPIVFARRRLLLANSNDVARLVLVCARITCVDILLRQPKRSSIFLNSYFQTFPSFICQVASVGNLMANRAINGQQNASSAQSIESLIALASMSLLSTVITETNHVTQGLSVLSANNPHSGILANFLNTCLSPSCLANGEETFMLSKAAIFLLSSSIQTARHPGSVGNPTFLRKILESLTSPVSDPGVTHACCVCLEVAIESSMNGFTLLFRDLEAFDKLIDRASFLLNSVISSASSHENPSRIMLAAQKAVSSIFSLLRLSFQTHEFHVGINLHEKLTVKNSSLTNFFVSVIHSGSLVMGKNAYNGCLTLIGNVMADDPLIISTIVECGIADALIDCATRQAGVTETHPEILASIFVAICALHLHDSGAKRVSERGNCLNQMLSALAADEWSTSLAPTDQGKSSVMGYIMNEENRIVEDIGMVVGQSCDDINRNTNGWGDKLVGDVVAGLDKLVSKQSIDSLGIRVIPALRMLFGGVLAITDGIEKFLQADGMTVLIKILSHPNLEPGIILKQVANTSRNHPLLSVFKMIGQRGGKDKPHQWQQPLAYELDRLLPGVMTPDFFSRITTICSLATAASPTATASGNTSDLSGGPLLFIVSKIGSILPELLSHYIEHRDKNDFASLGWVAVKNSLQNVARNASSVVMNARAIVGQGEVSEASHLICRTLACALTQTVKNSFQNPEYWTEIVDLLVRLNVEDRSHSVRPVLVAEFFKSGGFVETIKLLREMIKSAPSSLEALLVFFERLSSYKRFTNASVTNCVFKEPDQQMELKNLVTSICTLAGECCDESFSEILAIESLSSTSATAVMKIFSHAITMVDIQESGARVGSTRRAASPARKKARVPSSDEEPSPLLLKDIISVYGPSFDESVTLKYRNLVSDRKAEDPFPYSASRQVTKVSKSVASEFVARCIALGDKSNCEIQVAELLNRHIDAFADISIRAKNSKIKDNGSYVSDVATEYSFQKKSRTACAILASRISVQKLKSSNEIGKSVGQMIEAILAVTAGPTASLVDAVADPSDWIGPLIAMIHPSIMVGVFGGIDVEIQRKFLLKLIDILSIVTDEKINPRSCQAVVHACLPVIASLLTHRENVEICLPHISVFLNLPSKCRTSVTAPLITEILMNLASNDLWTAVRLSKELDAFSLGGERLIDDFISNEVFVSAIVMNREIFEKLSSQVFRRRGNKIVRNIRIDNEDDDDNQSDDSIDIDDSFMEPDFSVFDPSIDKIGMILDQLVNVLIKSLSLIDKTNCEGLGDLIESPDSAMSGATYPLAITAESCLLMITGVLSEVAGIREVDERYKELQLRILSRLVSEAGRFMVSNLSVIEEEPKHESKIGTSNRVFKLAKVWMDTINRSSPWMSVDVLRMVADELALPAPETPEAFIVQTYAYSGLVFLLTEGSDIPLDLLEKLIPILSNRFKKTCSIESQLCRFDTHYEFQPLLGSLYLLINSLRTAAETARLANRAQERIEDDNIMDDDSGDGSCENSDEEDEEGDEEDEGEDSEEEDDDSVSDNDMMEIIGSVDVSDNDEDESDDEIVFVNDREESLEEGVLDEGGEGGPHDSQDGDEDDMMDDLEGEEGEDEGDDMDGEEDWEEDGEEDWWDDDGYDDAAEWEEDTDDGDNDDDVLGEQYLVDDEEGEIGQQVAEIMGHNGGEAFSSGLSSAVPIGSPITGPSPPSATLIVDQQSALSLPPTTTTAGIKSNKDPFRLPDEYEFPDSVVTSAKRDLEKFGSEILPEMVESEEESEDNGEEEEEEDNPTGDGRFGEGESIDASSMPGGDLSELSEEAQFAGLNNLTAEERLSIQQALAATGEEFDFGDESDGDDDDDDLHDDADDVMDDSEEIRDNIRSLIPPGMNRGEVVIEMPSGLDPTAQATAITAAINSLDMMRMPNGGPIRRTTTNRNTKKQNSLQEFMIEDELLKPETADKLCSDSPQFTHKNVCTWSDLIATALGENVASVSTRALLLRDQIPFKGGLDRVLIQLCLDPRSRNVLLSTLFDSLLNFVYPSRVKCSWSFTNTNSDVVEKNVFTNPPRIGVYDSSLHPLIDNVVRHVDCNNPSQCRSVGSGRMINTITMILNHVPRARGWFGLANMLETRSDVVPASQMTGSQSMFELHSAGRRTPEKPSKRRQNTPPLQPGGYTSSDGEGPLIRAVSGQMNSGSLLPPRKTTPITVAIKLLTSPLLQSSPSHSLILINLIAQCVEKFPLTATDREEQEGFIRQAVTEEAIQLLCDFLVENRNRLRHMPEFDRAVTRASQVLVMLCSDIRTREMVRSRLIVTGTRLVGEIMERLNQLENFTAVPLVRLFRTAKEAFGTKRIEAGEEETFLDFASSISNIQSLWDAVDTRLAAHNNLLLGMPSVAQQALAKRRGEENMELVGGGGGQESASPEDMEKPGNRIAALETISKLIPLVELFLSAHDITGIVKKDLTTERESRVKKCVMDFIERHRRPINSMVKSRPSILNRAFATLVAICPHMLDFDNKRQFFRAKLRHQDGDKRQPSPPQIKLTVRRDDVFRDSYSKLQVRTKDEWRGRLNITFQGEEGVDAGGLVREWFTLLAREIFNPNYALFTPASGRPSTFLINPASSVNPDHIHYFRFCGRFIGKAVYDNQRIDAYFVRSFYKYMLGKEVTWRDMETTDPDYFKNLNWILENDMTDVDYYSFTVEENEFGKLKIVELVPGGEDKRVTEENKQEYVRLVCEHKLTRGIQEQLKAFLQGFHELIPEHIVGSLFDDKELEMLISGLPTIDIEDLKRNTDYVQYTSESVQIKWFWEALEKFSEDELAWFLQFVTGSTQVPLEGFKGLAGMHGPQRFSIHRIRVEDRLPTAHTCFNQLDLPEYTSYEILESKLKQAVREGHSGFGFI